MSTDQVPNEEVIVVDERPLHHECENGVPSMSVRHCEDEARHSGRPVFREIQPQNVSVAEAEDEVTGAAHRPVLENEEAANVTVQRTRVNTARTESMPVPRSRRAVRTANRSAWGMAQEI